MQNQKLFSGRPSSTDRFVEKARQVHGEAFSYSLVSYVSSSTKVQIICPTHGAFEQTPNNHLRGQGCAACRKNSPEEFLKMARKKHGDRYDYTNTRYQGRRHLIEIICRMHGTFTQGAGHHLQGRGCPGCNPATQRKTPEQFFAEAARVHGEYSYSGYLGAHTPVEITCPAHGAFLQSPDNHLHGKGCRKCTGHRSRAEDELAEALKAFGDVRTGSRDALGQRMEVDILIGNLAVEHNGLYWHSEQHLPNDYHQKKTALAKGHGLQLIHVFEDEWLEKRDIVLARIQAKLGQGERKHARKAAIRPVPWVQAKAFYLNAHLQGAGVAGESWGLYFEDNLAACITLGRRNNTTEILRYASLGTVVGGFGRLFQHYTRAHPETTSILSYADLRWGEGNVYATQGFQRHPDTRPGYFWIKGQKRFSRQMFQKHKLADLLKNFDPKLSESENMHQNGFLKIFDCGHAKWTWSR